MPSVTHNWQQIVELHGPMALETAWRILGHAGDAEDAAQEAMMQAFKLHGSNTVLNWGGLLRRLTTCRALDMLRRRKTARSHVLVGLGSQAASSNGATHDSRDFDPAATRQDAPDARLCESELTQRLRMALSQISEREAEVFSLHYFGELDNHAIAQQLGCTVGAVGVALHKARVKLQRWLVEEGLTEENRAEAGHAGIES